MSISREMTILNNWRLQQLSKNVQLGQSAMTTIMRIATKLGCWRLRQQRNNDQNWTIENHFSKADNDQIGQSPATTTTD